MSSVMARTFVFFPFQHLTHRLMMSHMKYFSQTRTGSVGAKFNFMTEMTEQACLKGR